METDLFDFAYIPDWYGQLEELEGMVLPEPWQFKRPSIETKNQDTPILERYIHIIFRKQSIDYNSTKEKDEAAKYFHIENECACFHTGLYTERYKAIYAFFDRNKRRESMGLAEEELQPLVSAWRDSNPNITEFWWAVDRAVKECIKKRVQTETHGIRFDYRSGMLFITLFSGRRLAYVKPRIGENQFGGESVTYMGVGGTKKWERLESYGPKFVENIVQAVSRDILCYAMRTLRNCSIVAHVHDEIIIEADRRMFLPAVCEQMGRTPPWAKGLEDATDELRRMEDLENARKELEKSKEEKPVSQKMFRAI